MTAWKRIEAEFLLDGVWPMNAVLQSVEKEDTKIRLTKVTGDILPCDTYAGTPRDVEILLNTEMKKYNGRRKDFKIRRYI